MTTLIHKCEDCGAIIAERELSDEALSYLYGRADANPDRYTFPTQPDDNTIIKWDICTPCYEYEMQDDYLPPSRKRYSLSWYGDFSHV